MKASAVVPALSKVSARGLDVLDGDYALMVITRQSFPYFAAVGWPAGWASVLVGAAVRPRLVALTR